MIISYHHCSQRCGQLNIKVASDLWATNKAACGAWTTLQAWLITLGEDHMSLITYSETHTRVKALKSALLDHTETS